MSRFAGLPRVRVQARQASFPERRLGLLVTTALLSLAMASMAGVAASAEPARTVDVHNVRDCDLLNVDKALEQISLLCPRVVVTSRQDGKGGAAALSTEVQSLETLRAFRDGTQVFVYGTAEERGAAAAVLKAIAPSGQTTRKLDLKRGATDGLVGELATRYGLRTTAQEPARYVAVERPRVTLRGPLASVDTASRIVAGIDGATSDGDLELGVMLPVGVDLGSLPPLPQVGTLSGDKRQLQVAAPWPQIPVLVQQLLQLAGEAPLRTAEAYLIISLGDRPTQEAVALALGRPVDPDLWWGWRPETYSSALAGTAAALAAAEKELAGRGLLAPAVPSDIVRLHLVDPQQIRKVWPVLIRYGPFEEASAQTRGGRQCLSLTGPRTNVAGAVKELEARGLVVPYDQVVVEAVPLRYERNPRVLAALLLEVARKVADKVSISCDSGANGLLSVIFAGPREQVDALEAVLATLDAPRPQVQLDVWAFQLSGEDPRRVARQAQAASGAIEAVRYLISAYTEALGAYAWAEMERNRATHDRWAA